MKSFAVISVLLASVAIAQPHGHQHRRHHQQQQHEKRALVTEIEWVTKTQYVTKLVDSTTTVWISGAAETASTTDQAKFIETPQPKKKKKKTSSTSTSTSTTSTSIYVAPEPTTTSTTSTSAYVAPEETTTSSTSEYVAPVQSTTSIKEEEATSAYVAPTTTSEAPAAATTTASGGDSSGDSGTTYSGDITYFTIGRGSCGDDDTGKDLTESVVALSGSLLSAYEGANSNDNSLCGKTITIKANGKTTTATIKDKCPECEYGAIDVSEKVFNDLYGSLDKGRGDCEWYLN